MDIGNGENIPTEENVEGNAIPAPIDSRRSTGLDENQDSYLIANNQLIIGSKLGKGSFGEVFLATWEKSDGNQIDVAVKRLHHVQEVKEALQEVSNMQKLKHDNVVRLYGITIDIDMQNFHPIQLVFELCEGGSLYGRLKDTEKPRLLVSQLLIYTKQLCNGMDYLESKQCVHRDLAARNILLSKNEEIIKISDFGLTRFLKKDQIYYQMKSNHGIPYRWYPPEAIWHHKFSHKSDVWSYGMTLWEMFTYGELPWAGRSIFQILSDMKENIKLRKPDQTDTEVYNIMCSCWNINKDLRPSFSQLKTRLANKEFATGKCKEAQKQNQFDTILSLDENDEVIILYEMQPKLWFGQSTKTGEFGQIYSDKIKKTSDASITKDYTSLSLCNINESNKSSSKESNTYEVPIKLPYKKSESLRVEASALGRTNLFIQIDNCCIVMYPRTEDLEELLKRPLIDCCIGCPPEDVIKQLSNRFPQIEWITWDKNFINSLKENKIYENRIHFSENYISTKLSIKKLKFRVYKSRHGYVIQGPTSKVLYLWPHDLSADTEKQIKSHRPFNVAFFCISSLRNPKEVKATIDLVKAQKNVLIFAKERPLDEEINFIKELIKLGFKQEDLIILEKNNPYQQNYFKDRARRNFLYYLSILSRNSNESIYIPSMSTSSAMK